MPKNIIQKIVVGGILIRSNKALILQRSSSEEVFPNIWEIPSGKKEPLETTTDALIREFFEETGISINVIMPISVFDYQVEKTEEIRDSTQINFLVQVIDKNLDVKLSKEHTNYAWVDNVELEKYDITDLTKNAIINALNIYDKLY